MSYKALYRTYRPNSFDTVVGQQHIVKTLQNAIASNRMSHAYLFCGPRGTGKTSVAKLLAKSVNCSHPEKAPCNECDNCISIQAGNHPDVIEIDAASNNGVDEIRDLIEKVKYAPLQAKYKVYIIDEVHMLSQGAFNALLKTLEEPPSHVIFILATTEPHKVIPTIISRCQRYDFVRVNKKEIQQRIEEVLVNENITFEEEATRLISQLADGGVRDALSILEQCIAYAGDHLMAAHVNEIYGIATTQDKLELIKAVFVENVSELMIEIERISQKNIDIRRLTTDLMDILKEAVIYSYTKDETLLSKLSHEEVIDLLQVSPVIMLKMIDDLMDTTEKYRSSSNLLSYFEICLLKLMSHMTESEYSTQIVKEKTIKIPSSVSIVKSKIDEPITPIAKDVVKEIVNEVENESENFTDKSIKKDSVKIIKPAKTTPVESMKEVYSGGNTLEKVTLDTEFLLQLLVAGNKKQKLEQQEYWKTIGDYKRDWEWQKFANLLSQSEIAVSGEGYILIADPEISTVNELNSPDTQEELAKFIEKVVGTEGKIFAITHDEFKKLSGLFVQRREMNSLPEPYVAEFKPVEKEAKVSKNTKKEPLNPNFDLFGSDNVDIITEEITK